MKIYFSGTDAAVSKLLSAYGNIVSGQDWFEKSHVLVIDDAEKNDNEALVQEAQKMLKPVLLLSSSNKKSQAQETTKDYPFITIGQYKNQSEAKMLVDAFFEEYGGIARNNNPYCCGGGCCSNL